MLSQRGTAASVAQRVAVRVAVRPALFQHHGAKEASARVHPHDDKQRAGLARPLVVGEAHPAWSAPVSLWAPLGLVVSPVAAVGELLAYTFGSQPIEALLPGRPDDHVFWVSWCHDGTRDDAVKRAARRSITVCAPRYLWWIGGRVWAPPPVRPRERRVEGLV